MNKMITPEKCFQLYMSVKTHFTNERYDAIKYNGRVKNADRSHLEKRNDRFLFSSLAKKFNNGTEAASFFVANFAYGNDYPIENYDIGLANLKVWQKRRQSLTKMFTDDISYLCDQGICYNDFVECNPVPKVYILFKTKKINIETLAIIDQLDPYIEKWKSQLILKQEALKIKKLSSFIKFNEQNFRSIYQALKNETR